MVWAFGVVSRLVSIGVIVGTLAVVVFLVMQRWLAAGIAFGAVAVLVLTTHGLTQAMHRRGIVQFVPGDGTYVGYNGDDSANA